MTTLIPYLLRVYGISFLDTFFQITFLDVP
jgi:hypothetical protein